MEITSSLRLLTSNTVPNPRFGAANPRIPGGPEPNVNAPNVGTPPAIAPAYGDVSGDAKLCINGFVNTPGAPT